MKINTGLLTAAFLLLGCLSEVNAQQSTFTKVYYDPAGSAQAYAVARATDQNYVIAGEKNGIPLAMKVDPSGSILWSKQLTGLTGGRFHCITTTYDSGFILAGRTIDVISGEFNILCVKITSSGDTAWTRAVDMGHSASVLSVQQTSDLGFIVAGYLQQSSAPYSRMVILKFDMSGACQWIRMLDAGNNNNSASSVKQTPDGGFIVMGNMEYYPPFAEKACLIKLTPNGDISWARKQLLDYPVNSVGWDVVVTNSGFMCLLSSASIGEIITKTDFSGNVLWSRKYDLYYGDFFSEFPYPHLVTTPGGGYAFVNKGFGFDPVLKTDSAGIPVWSKRLLVIPTDIIPDGGNGFLVLGNGPVMGVGLAPTDNPQIGILRLDSTGNSTDCITDNSVSSDTCIVSFIPVTFTSTPGGAWTTLHPAISGPTLLIFEGCVAVTGGTGEIDEGKSAFSMAPNPSDGHFLLTNLLPDGEPILRVEIFSAIGKTIYRSDLTINDQMEINLPGNPDGLYYIRAQYRNGTCTRKVIITH